jgi:hypothetical protein
MPQDSILMLIFNIVVFFRRVVSLKDDSRENSMILPVEALDICAY